MQLEEISIFIDARAEDPLLYFLADVLKLEKYSVEMKPGDNTSVVKIYTTEEKREEIERRVEDYIKALPEKGLEISEYRIESRVLEEEDWLYKWREFFKPIDIENRIRVRPPWEEKALDKIDLVIHPKMGFGTGQHPTTFLCLKHMVHENLKGKRIVDVGAGSGILGAGAILSGAQWADFIEIDEMAIESCRETLELNGLEEKGAIYLTDILKDSNFFQGQKYDLGFMNIIAEVIIRVLELDWIATVPVWYLSGIIREKKQQVTDKVKEIGYSIVNEEDLGEWVFLKIKKGGL